MTKGERKGGQKSQKIDDVFYERPLGKKMKSLGGRNIMHYQVV